MPPARYFRTVEALDLAAIERLSGLSRGTV
jgi:hypothetical protein